MTAPPSQPPPQPDAADDLVPATRRAARAASGRQRPDLAARARRQLRLVTSRLGARVNALPHLGKWLVLGSLIGVIAGIGAVVFYSALTFAGHLLLTDIGGYVVPTPAGEGGIAGSGHFTRWWAIPLVVAGGGLASGLLVFTFAPEAEGHGTDAAIEAVHQNPRGIRLRAVLVKIIASAITIGSGGSGGREGPTAQISAGFASFLARALDLSPEDGRIAVSVGIGSGIGAIFSAPLGGAVLAAEIVYRDDFEVGALLPGLFATVISYSIFGAVYGFRPLFAVAPYAFHQPIQLLWFAILGGVAALVGLTYANTFYATVRLNARLPIPRRLRPALGGLLVGLLALATPTVLGTGYGFLQRALDGGYASLPLLIVVLLPFGRILATSLSIGTGGSGGVFGPGMVIGAFTGYAVWRVLEPFAPGVGHSPGPFVVIGMMSCFGSIARAPLAVMIMVAEMTGSLGEVAPAMVAVSIATLIVAREDNSIYRAQLRNRENSAASRFQFGLPLISRMLVDAVAPAPRLVLPETTPATQAAAELAAAGLTGAPVVDSRGTFLGVVTATDLAAAAARGRTGVTAGDLADPTSASVVARAPLRVGVEALTQAAAGWVTVVDRNRRVSGVLSVSDLLAGYRKALDSDVGRMSRISGRTGALEEVLGADSPLAGHRLRDGGLPPGCIVVTVQRADRLLFATGDLEFAAGDVVSVLADPERMADVAALLRGSRVPVDPAVAHGPPLV